MQVQNHRARLRLARRRTHSYARTGNRYICLFKQHSTATHSGTRYLLPKHGTLSLVPCVGLNYFFFPERAVWRAGDLMGQAKLRSGVCEVWGSLSGPEIPSSRKQRRASGERSQSRSPHTHGERERLGVQICTMKECRNWRKKWLGW